MKFYIGEGGSSGQKFDNINDFLDTFADLANTYAENGEEWFEIEIVNSTTGENK